MNIRGKSRVSEFSRPSTYSNLPEQTTLTQLDILKPGTANYTRDTFISDINQDVGGTQRKTPGVRFDSHASENRHEQDVIPQKKKKLTPMDLKNRLYDRPENSQAIKVVRHQEAARGHTAIAPLAPIRARPSSGKAVLPSPFKTVILKRDVAKKQATKDVSSSDMITLNKLTRMNSRDILPAISPKPPVDEKAMEERSGSDLMDDRSEVFSIASDETAATIISHVQVTKPEKKTVTFTEEVPNEETKLLAATPDKSQGTQPRVGGLTGSSHQSAGDTNSPLELASSFLPMENKAGPSPLDSRADISTIAPSTKTNTKSKSDAEAEGKGSKIDPSLVFTYLKKNIYDDEVPENDNFEETLIAMRERLGWNSELPRHGPGVREKMEALTDHKAPEEDVEAAIASKEDDGQFAYALPRNRKDRKGRYNPYDLECVSAHLARKEKCYYTGTASNVTRVDVDFRGVEEMTRTPTMWWLWEKRLFDAIYDKPVFNLYLRWKTFNIWKLNVIDQKFDASKLVLTKTLFTANEVLQGCALHVRSLCEAASSSLTGDGEGDYAISLVDLLRTETLTLDEFMTRQRVAGEKALRQINALRDKCVDILWESCATVAEMEGITKGIRPEEKVVRVQETMEVDKQPKYKIKTRYGAIPVFEKKEKEKSDRPSYAQISEWRKILHRLSYFLRSVDYLLLELLRRLVITGTKHLVKFVVNSYNTGMLEDEERRLRLEIRKRNRKFYDSPTESLEDLTLNIAESNTAASESAMVKQDSQRNFGSSMSKGDGSDRNAKKTPRGAMDVPSTPSLVQFDFDKPMEEEQQYTIDEVLEQIEKQNEVIEQIVPIMSLQIVLKVPEAGEGSSAKRKRSGKRSLRSLESKSQDTKSIESKSVTETIETARSQHSKHSTARKTPSEKKGVTFHKDISDDSGSEYEEEESESDDESDYYDDETDQTSNRFAYTNSDADFEKRVANRELSIKAHRTHIVMAPSEDEVLVGFRNIVFGFEATIGQVVSMLKEPKLAVFYSPPKHDLKLNYDEEMRLENMTEENVRPWPDTELLFNDDPEYQAQINELMEHVQNAMDMVVDYSYDFDRFCDMVERSRRVDVEGSMSKKMWTTEEFSHVLRIHTEQVRAMNGMPKERRLGHVMVETLGFCNSCKPFPESVLTAVVNKLPNIAYQRNEELLTIVKGASKKLDKYPTTVEEFVDHLAFLGKMTSEMGALDKEFDIVTKLYTICREFNVEVPPEELALYQTLAPSFQHLKTVILYAEAKKEDNIRKFTQDLDKLIYGMRFKVINIKEQVRDPILLHGDTMATTALEKITDLTEEVTDLSNKARSYANYQERFGSSMTGSKRFSEEFLLMDRGSDNSAQEIQQELSEIERDLTLRRLLWESQEEWDKLATEWTATPFDALDVDLLQKSVNRFSQTVYMLEKGLPHNEVIPRLKEKVTNFKAVMPCISSLRNTSLRPRHFQQIQVTIGKAIERDRHFTLGNLLEMNIIKHKEKIQDISTTATNEATLERMLQKIIDLWQLTDFRLLPHVSGQVMIVAAADDIMAMLEESQVTVGTIRGSRYVGPIKPLVEEWERKLQVFARTLDEWMTCQRNWLYLEQIFTTPDIQRQLPNESKLFAQVDKTWKDIMRKTEDRPNALKSATSSGVLESLQAANGNLEKIQKCLEDYLETKRLVFPRFYFLSNDELLDILAQSKNPDAVQPHLGKCFGNIAALDIKQIPRQPLSVKTMASAEGEVINMPKNVRANGPVEQWLGSVESGMFDTVKRHLRLGLADYQGLGLEDWVIKHPGQVVLTVSQIIFAKEVTFCLKSHDPIKQLTSFKDKNIRQLTQLARLVSTNLLAHKRLSVNALLTIAVHNRDIMINMIDEKVKRVDDFEWSRQLRYEWEEQSNHCNVLQSNATFTYGYEYLGCSQRLVITPLTDRCFLTLTGAQYLHLGGSPAGPAGTGKTETVKDLAKSMGKQCVVFNCSEGLDFKMLGKFFSGMAQSGTWGCFDEFNRIDTEVLSVVAQQIHTIKTAKDQMAPRFVFEGKDIRLNMSCGIFITMNPTYAGRVELPDNLKSLFRMVAMMVPDYALIAEIILFSEGFTDAKSLSRKIVNLYQLASKQLSQQDHYDFGMRAIKSVLVMAGQRKRQVMIRGFKEKIGLVENRSHMSEKDEAHILIHSLRDANIPKFLAEDVPLFQSIMDDLFPGINPPEPDHGALEKAINMAVRDHGLQPWPSQIEKVKQLHNQILVRHGVMLVGPTGGGKTTVRSVLQRALVLLPTMVQDDMLEGQAGLMDKRKLSLLALSHAKVKKGHVETFTVNPKCVKLGELYGETDPNTFEWSDGLIASATRRLAKEGQTGPPVDEASRPASAGISTQKTPSMASHSYQVGSIVSGATGATSGPPSEHNTTSSELSNEPLPPPEPQSYDTVPTDWSWIILDGPVDTIWVENLNTVLDDSKVLCLANGERISLTPGMRLLFEVDSLAQASPATVSRCAMVYMDPVDLGWRPYVRTWLARLPKEIPESAKQHLLAMFEHSIDKGMDFVRLNRKFLMLPVPELSLVMCLCNILSAFIEFMSKNGGFGTADKEPERPPSAGSEHSFQSKSSSTRPGSRQKKKRAPRRKKDEAKEQKEADKPTASTHKSHASGKTYYMQRNPGNLTILFGKLFVFAFTWSYGGSFKRQDEMDDDGGISRKGDGKKEVVIEVDIASEFDNFVREVFDIEPPLGVRLPASHRSIYSYFVDMDSGNFVPWDALIPTTQSLIEKGAMMSIGDSMGGETKADAADNAIVPTVDTVRYSFLASLLLINKNPVLITGESGTGKTAIIKDMLRRLAKDGGASFKQRTIMGSVLNFTDRSQTLLDNISSLTQLSKQDDDGNANLDLVMGGGRGQKQMGVVSSMLQLSAQTSAHRMVLALKNRLIKKGRDTLGAPKGKRVLVFVDDLNMPSPEEYGAQPPLELLRQFMDLGGYYDMKKLNWKDILDVTVIAACGPPGGGRNPVSGRLLKHFSMLALPQPSTRSLQHIYQVQLGRYFQDKEFTPDVRDSLFPLVSAAIGIYYKMCAVMRPTPAKSHYTFNCRDLSQVISGLMQADETVMVNSDNCATLYAHEATRVFHDRLVDTEDRRLFFEMLADNLHDYFKVKWTAQDLMETRPILFGDFLDVDDASSSGNRIYKQINDRGKLNTVLEEFYMRQQMGNSQAPRLVFFNEAVEHVIRAARVFRQPGGHMLLVGLDGTGKQTAVQLAAYIAECKLFRLTLTRGYNMESFREDLKKVCIMAGVKNIKTVFLLTDSDIVKEVFLEDINCILNSGEVPDLFDNEEMDGIVMDLKPAASEALIPDTRQAVYNFFIQRVQKNMHIVMAMSPAGSKFRQRCRMNPSLINCCTIDWFVEWNREAMLSVARVYFQKSAFVAEKDEEIPALKERVAHACGDIHDSIHVLNKRYWEEMRRHYYITPSSYMELIRLFSKMLREQRNKVMENRDRLTGGLDKLSEAESLVGTMQEELVSLGPKIEEKAKDTEVLLAQLEKDQTAVDQVREIVEAEEAVMQKETKVVQDYADECQADLASVIPAIQLAIDSLNTLNKKDISELRVFLRPPALVTLVMSAVCTLLQTKPDWSTAKQVLADANFLQRLFEFDKNSVPEKVFAKLRLYTKHPDFTPEMVGLVSMACKSMCQWVLAMEHYHEVIKMAKPKQKKVNEAKEALGIAQSNLAKKQESLRKIQGHLQMLQQQYTDSVNQREELKNRKERTKNRLQMASLLIRALSGEKVRWAESVSEIDFKLKGLVGDTLVSASVVAYLGAFTIKYRKELISQWRQLCDEKEIPIAKHYDFVRSLVTPAQVLKWHTEGLPQDNHSTENAIIVKHGRKWPLLIDPQGQASKWIKEMEGNNLKEVSAHDPHFMRNMERAIRMGEPILLKEVGESLDPSMTTILQQEVFIRGGHKVIKLGDTEIEYNEHFRLYLSTNLSTPHYLPGVCIQVTIINFTVTFDGLQEQLLSSVVRQERPQLENERTQLLDSIASDQQVVLDLENKTLSLLQKAQGHILDDQDLIQTLEKSKNMAGEIKERIHQSEITEKKLNVARKRYLPVAIRGAVLYFVLADLASVDVMYQFSLAWFQDMFINCISQPDNISNARSSPRLSSRNRRNSTSPDLPPLGPTVARKSDRIDSAISGNSGLTGGSGLSNQTDIVELQAHMKKMINRLTSSIYRVVSVALFADHQLIFSFMMCTAVLRANAKYHREDMTMIEDIEWTTFLQGNIMASMMTEEERKNYDGLSPIQRLEYVNKPLPPKPRWLTEAMWAQCQHLEATFDTCEKLTRSILNCPQQWQVFTEEPEPYHLLKSSFDVSPYIEGKQPEEMVVFHWEHLTEFQRLILIKILKPQALTSAIRLFVEEQMGAKFVNYGAADLNEMFEKSDAKTPLIFILSPGSDPGAQLQRFAKELRGSTLHLDMISLGRGQGPKAEDLISKAQILKGRWIFLQNCHLAASWMPRLQSIVESFQQPGAGVDPQFRLWLSSKPDPSFPISILQMGQKMTVEPPRGVKANLQRTMLSGGSGTVSEKLYEEVCPEKPAWKNLLLGLCFFNAVLHERKKYHRLGWNIPYEFNDSDLEVSTMQLQLLLEEQDTVPWHALWYLTGEVTFGGRVTDDWDRRCLHSLMRKFYTPLAMEEGYHYSGDQVYHPVGKNSTYKQVADYIESLPVHDNPDLFGMDMNAEKAYLELQTDTLVSTVLSVQPRLTTGLVGSGKSSDDLILDMCADMLKHVPWQVHSAEDDEPPPGQPPNLGYRDMIKLSNGQDLLKIKKKLKITEPPKSKKGDLGEVRDEWKLGLEELRRITSTAMYTVMRQEIDRFNTLLQIIHKSLTQLIKAVKGEVVMSDSLEEAYNALLNQRVPIQWKNASYESNKALGPWIKDLIMRVDFFDVWCDHVVMAAQRAIKPAPPVKAVPRPPSSVKVAKDGEQNSLEAVTTKSIGSKGSTPIPKTPQELLEERVHPRSYWLSSFFFPQGFLTAVLQSHARKMKVSVDSLKFNFEIQHTHSNEDWLIDVKQKLDVKKSAFEGPAPPQDGVLVFGLFIDGARWDVAHRVLGDSLPGQRFYRLPELHFIPVSVEEDISSRPSTSALSAVTHAHDNSSDHSYEAPLYRTSTRAGTLSSTGHSTNFVTSITLPSNQPPDYWIMRGVALLCGLHDV